MRLLHLTSLALLAWTHAGWGLLLRALRPLGRVADDRESRPAGPPTGLRVADGTVPRVSVVVAAYAEQDVIAATVAALRAQEWPAELLEILVACDGSPDATAERARAAGADVVLELERGGKHAAQAAAVARARGEILVFSDANTRWAPDALAELVAAFEDPDVGYACGRVAFVAADGATNQEGAYWRLEMALRRRESDWWSVTAGNGAIYALRADVWPRLRTERGHDLSLPHQVVRLGLLAVDRPTARATEPLVPTLEGESARKRRMMAQAWRIVLRGGRDGGLGGGILDPRGLPPRYLAAIVSHRWLRYASPLLHLLALAAGALLLVRGRATRIDRLLLAAHLALGAGAAAGTVVPSRPLLLCRYYVSMTATIALGLADFLRAGAPAGWEPAEGTR
ncbi:glycosyltransferase [Patulibacter brassicae]|uniref:Glycosyltransferase n=1 Tax=Patulibacter brassicae TaxID=1705717 RepID=A0ABU4VKN1_9ACTN|nr:glycosyltransferase [Patulibacter brassicae]MDX8152421.1 glycosyltransferase [Patulibacter brassicae]